MARPGYAIEVPVELQDRVVQTAQEFHSSARTSIMLFEQTSYAVSSTEIRALLAAGGPRDSELQNLLPSSVINYIQQHQSYTLPTMQPDQIKDQVVEALEDIKGQDIRVLEIGDISDFADFMVVASGTSDTHVKALAREASNRLRAQGVKPLNEDGQELGEWVLVDFGDVVLHVMRPEVREYYDLEKLWDHDVRELLKQHREQQDR
jgi:ribosome-associated protein